MNRSKHYEVIDGDVSLNHPGNMDDRPDTCSGTITVAFGINSLSELMAAVDNFFMELELEDPRNHDATYSVTDWELVGVPRMPLDDDQTRIHLELKPVNWE